MSSFPGRLGRAAAVPLLLANVLVACGGGGPTPERHSAPAATPSRGGPTAATNFRGIYQFTGKAQVDNPSIKGGVLILHWADLEPAPGVYDWSKLDSGIRLWARHGKAVGVRLETYAPRKSETPPWLYEQGLPKLGLEDGSVAPQFWNPVYLSRLQELVTALAARYDGDSRITWVQAGVGVYGETKVDSAHHDQQRLQVWGRIGYTDAVWWETIQRIIGAYTSAFRRTAVAVAVDSTFIGHTPAYTDAILLAYLAERGVWTQHDSLSPKTKLDDPNWTRVPHLEEQYLSTKKTGDSLQADLDAALRAGATYALIYGDDIADPQNRSALSAAAAKATG